MKSSIADQITSPGAWGWCLAVGIVLVIVGLYCIWAEVFATAVSVIVLGGVLFVGGIAQIVGAFGARGAGHIILMLLVGVLNIIIGLMLIEHPLVGALAITLLIAALLVFGGIFRFFSALWLQLPGYAWIAISGVISIVLGILLWMQWPISAMWFIGFAVGLSFVFEGLSLSSLAWKLKPA